MQSKLYVSLALAGTVIFTSCGKLGELTADNFTVTPTPMEAVGGKVPVTINGRFPEKYLKKKAVVTVQPQLRYGSEAVNGQSATFQGESVQGNDQQISYKLGGNYTLKNTYDYVPAMQQSELYLTFKAKVGKKEVTIPEVKVDYGIVATSTLINDAVKTASTETAADKYQYAIKQSKQSQIKYLINQANIRNSELKGSSVQDFLKTLRDIKADQKGYLLDNVEVSAYASPDGSTNFNSALAQKREKSSKNYVNNQLKKASLKTNVDSKYTAEDWDGFKELVSQSNIQDKDVILRVLSMYQDPEEREKQIRNLSAGFDELAKEILPELRRARMTINYSLIGRTDDEIKQQYKNDASKLSVEEMLYAATLTNDLNEQKNIYTTTTKQYPSDYRAYNNLATIAYKQGDLSAAKNYLAQAESKNSSSAEVNANKALVALAEGNTTEAENALAKATTASNYKEIKGNIEVAKGNYAQAAQNLTGVKSNSAALAQILNKDYASAANTLSSVSNPDAMTSYLKAVNAARTNQQSTVIANLKDAISKDSSLKARAAKDLEFASLFNDAAFQNIVK